MITEVDEFSAEDEQRYRAAVEIANVPTLLMVLVQLTGDTTWLDEPYAPKRSGGLDDNDSAGLDEARQSEVRTAALAAIVAFKRGRPAAFAQPSNELLVRMLSVAMDEPVPPEYGPYLAEDLANAGLVPDPSDDQDPIEVPPGYQVLIIGAGIGGLVAAMALDRVGIPYVIFERNESVAGVWLENSYPGAGVDTPNHMYSFARVKHDWTHYFALRDDIHGYLERVADEMQVRPHIEFSTSVKSATYDEADQSWVVVAIDRAGVERTHRTKLLISAVGQFNNPKVPDIEGLGTFPGEHFHSSRWRHDLDLTGKRVAMIGNGVSGMQIAPAIADRVASLTLFQRSPQWAAPFDKFRTPVPDPVRFLLLDLPWYQWWYRQRLNWMFNDRLHSSLIKDPEWPHPERSVNAINDGIRRFFTRYIEAELGEDHQHLLPALVPDYPPYGKRILLDNGLYRALTKEHVHLVTDRVARIESDNIITDTGAEFPTDVLIFATGFEVTRYLASYEVYGKDGIRLRDEWNGDDARAFLGTSVPGFPNLFMLYGPNTQAGHGGSVIWNLEMQMTHILSIVRQMMRAQVGSVEVRREVYDRYNDDIDRRHEQMIWTHQGMSTYYRNSKGRVVVPMPYRNVDYWHKVRESGLADYRTEPRVSSD